MQQCAVPTPPNEYAVMQGTLCEDISGAGCGATELFEFDFTTNGCSGPTKYSLIKGQVSAYASRWVNAFAVTPADDDEFWRRSTCDMSTPTVYTGYIYDSAAACQADSAHELALAVIEGDFIVGPDIYMCPPNPT